MQWVEQEEEIPIVKPRKGRCGWREPANHLQIELGEDHIAIWTTVPFSPAADSAAGAASEARLAYNDAKGVGAIMT
jgi:hypothetical protein